MTPEQIERAARELVKLRGADPDGLAGPPHPYQQGASNVWECYVPEITRFCECGTAIAAAMQHEEKPPRKKTTTRKPRA
jgi:hypothetical protein